MTDAKVYQGFLDDKKIEEHCSTTFWLFLLGAKRYTIINVVHFLKKTLYSCIFGLKPDILK